MRSDMARFCHTHRYRMNKENADRQTDRQTERQTDRQQERKQDSDRQILTGLRQINQAFCYKSDMFT